MNILRFLSFVVPVSPVDIKLCMYDLEVGVELSRGRTKRTRGRSKEKEDGEVGEVCPTCSICLHKA